MNHDLIFILLIGGGIIGTISNTILIQKGEQTCARLSLALCACCLAIGILFTANSPWFREHYLHLGIIVALYAVYLFRRDGTTKKPYELYLAIIAPIIWPAVLILLVLDLLRVEKKTKYPMDKLWPVGCFVQLTNSPCIIDVEFESDAVKMIHNVYDLKYNKLQNLSESEMDGLHEELNRGKYKVVEG